ncbi:MAG: hypothetical protein GY829_04635 [Gammaproteobacteria bacterium]|nr:hypothetical protein [Gammaproteobacteria bacterium]
MQNKLRLGFILIILFFVGCKEQSSNNWENNDIPYDNSEIVIDDGATNVISDERMLLVLAAPSINIAQDVTEAIFEDIANFQINYAKSIINSGHDNVVILVDAETKSKYSELPEDFLLVVAKEHHIWTRDFTTVDPYNPIQFRYTWSTMSQYESMDVQDHFNSFVDQYLIERESTYLLLDGGNLVDNYAGKVITTTRFLTDNNLTYADGKQKLKELLGVQEVAIIEPDEEIMAHSDGQVMWLNENTLLVNDYTASFGAEYRANVLDELTNSFPGTTIIEVPVQFGEGACGINVNSVLTKNAIYVPVFGDNSYEEGVMQTMKDYSSKDVIPVESKGVCNLGGTVRCLTWQLTGENAEKLILAARND